MLARVGLAYVEDVDPGLGPHVAEDVGREGRLSVEFFGAVVVAEAASDVGVEELVQGLDVLPGVLEVEAEGGGLEGEAPVVGGVREVWWDKCDEKVKEGFGRADLRQGVLCMFMIVAVSVVDLEQKFMNFDCMYLE